MATPRSPAAPWSLSPQPEPSRPLHLPRNRHAFRRNPHVRNTIQDHPGGRSGRRGRRRPPGLALLVLAAAQLMVVLDATIVNVARPHIQRALGFSGTNLEWLVNAYPLSFGALLLLGGRAGDRLGRRKMFIAGLLLFSAASLAGGFADSQAFLLTARAGQGVRGALVAPAALSLITTTCPERPPPTRALRAASAISITHGATGLILRGVLATPAARPWGPVVPVPTPPPRGPC